MLRRPASRLEKNGRGDQRQMSGVVVRNEAEWDWAILRTGKANAVGPEFLEHLEKTLDEMEHVSWDAPARPLLVTGEKSAFSAGLDLPTLLEFERSRLERFLLDFDRVFTRLALCPRPTLAIVNGHAVAGGAILLLACDHRIGAATVPGTDKAYRIGLRESAIGLPLPRIAAALVRIAIGRGSAARQILFTGDLFPPEAAAELGLLDEVVPAEQLTPSAERAAKRFTQSTGRALAALKRETTGEIAACRDIAPDHTEFLDAWFSRETQRRLRAVVESLRR